VRFLLDEGLPFRLAAYLTSEGHDVVPCGADYPHALTDRQILAIAYGEQRIVLTNDKDFGDLVFRDRLPHAGVILFRLGYVPIDVRIALLREVLMDHAEHLDQFIVVLPGGSRVASAPEAP
jgi:predicted nuclease of predicted toxin-antitoxin system